MDLSPFLFGLYKLVKFLLYPFTWVVLLSAAILVLTLRPWPHDLSPLARRRVRWLRGLALSSFLIVTLLGNPWLARSLVGLLEAQAPAFEPSTRRHFDAIVVLGGGALGRGTLRPVDELLPLSLERTICGAELFATGWAPRLLVAGGDGAVFGRGPVEALEMKKLAVRLGVPEEAVLLETKSRTTYENAVETRRMLGQASVLLVTSASHVPRALRLFRKQGFEASAYPCGHLAKDHPWEGWDGNPFDLIPQAEALRMSTLALAEFTGLVLYRAFGLL